MIPQMVSREAQTKMSGYVGCVTALPNTPQYAYKAIATLVIHLIQIQHLHTAVQSQSQIRYLIK
jgi:hypothetical protein